MIWLAIFVVWMFWSITFLRCEWFMVQPHKRPRSGKLRHSWFIAEYDMWIGTYIDRKNDIAYWFPLPFVGLKLWRGEE